MNAEFHKYRIDFEYLNEIYTIISDPYQTLSELKDIVLKKIFPYPGDVHCFYKNFDLFDKEDEEISIIFPQNSKIKIKLNKPQKEKHIRNSVILPNIEEDIKTLEINSRKRSLNIEAIISPKQKYKTLRKKKIMNLLTLPSNDSISNLNNKTEEQTLNNNIKNNELFYFLHKSDKHKSAKKLLKDENSRNIENILNKYKSGKNQNFLTDGKKIKDFNFLLSSLKSKNLNILKFSENLSLNSGRNKISKDKIPQTEKVPKKSILKKLNISNEEKVVFNNNDSNRINNKDIDNKEDINNKEDGDNKDNIDDNYICSSCKTEIISVYCLNCNDFKCNSCIELCKVDEHKYLKIELEDDCINNINTYGELVISNIDKKLEEVLEFDKEFQFYDIINFKNNLITMINEIVSLYNQITNILHNIYKEKGVTKEMNKFESESNKIKADINDILHKAKSYLNSDKDISKPKYKIMNMKYFFNLINEKGKKYKTISNNIIEYSLNSTINSNMERCFKDIEKIMKSITNTENPFLLKDELKDEYMKLIINNNHLILDKKKLSLKRKRTSLIPRHIPILPQIKADNISDKSERDLNDSAIFN